MLTRRQWLACAAHGTLLATASPLLFARQTAPSRTSNGDTMPTHRCINIVNFLRGSEPRSPVDLLLPLREQKKVIVSHQLPATWLLQFDALVDARFVDELKRTMPADHEIGFWFEMNKPHCDAAGVEWRGRPGLTWDSHPSVAFAIGYTPAERLRLADAAMERFKSIWNAYPKSIASWNLDSITLAHLTDKYAIDAAAVCRDQIATDGFTIWGAPIAGYYPSKRNCWSPALTREEQIHTPIFRMLGQDPVYYYDTSFKLPDGRVVREPDTMEPVWTSGRSTHFVDAFLRMISESPTQRFAYAQIGQENNFGWPEMQAAYPMQIEKLAALCAAKSVVVETMGATGRRFKGAFDVTPTQAQIMLNDPFGNTDPAERTIWYQSRFYRANLHIVGDVPYLRDLTVYSDRFEQPFLNEATRLHEVPQRSLAVIDGYHWRKDNEPRPSAGGFFLADGEPVRLSGPPTVTETADTMRVELPVGERAITIVFDERGFDVTTSQSASTIGLDARFDRGKSSLTGVEGKRVTYRFADFGYAISANGRLRITGGGWIAEADARSLRLELSQDGIRSGSGVRP